MPRQYEAIRDSLAAKGMDYDEAQSHAAAIYNSTHKSAPVTGSEGVGRLASIDRAIRRRRVARKAIKL